MLHSVQVASVPTGEKAEAGAEHGSSTETATKTEAEAESGSHH